MEKTTLGIEENIEGALCYLLGWVTGIIFYIIEKDSKFVRFHAKQSIIVFLPLHIISFLLGGAFLWGSIFFWGAWFIAWLIRILLWLLMFILWVILIIKAYQGEMFKLPIAGDIAEKGL